MFKYNLNYYFRKKTNLEKYFHFHESQNNFEDTGESAVIYGFSLITAFFIIVSLSVFAFAFLNIENQDKYYSFAFVTGTIGLLMTAIFSLFVTISPYLHFIDFFNIVFYKKYETYNQFMFKKESAKVLNFLEQIGFDEYYIKKIIYECVFNDNTSYSKEFLNAVHEYYIKEKFKKCSNLDEINNVITNHFNGKIENKENIKQQEQDIVFFEEPLKPSDLKHY